MSQADNLVAFAREVRESSLKRLRVVPAGHENWRITPEDLSFADIAQHLVDADEWLFEKLKGKDLASTVPVAGLVEVQRRDQYLAILDALQASGRRRAELLAQMTEQRLAEPVYDDRLGKDVTAWWIIVRRNLDHEIHHRGQLAAYLSAVRAKG